MLECMMKRNWLSDLSWGRNSLWWNSPRNSGALSLLGDLLMILPLLPRLASWLVGEQLSHKPSQYFQKETGGQLPTIPTIPGL